MQPVELGPGRCQSLTVAAPWGKKLDEPALVRFDLGACVVQVEHELVEAGKVESLGLPIVRP